MISMKWYLLLPARISSSSTLADFMPEAMATLTVVPLMSMDASRMPASWPRTAVSSMGSCSLPVSLKYTVLSAASITPPVTPNMTPAPV